MCGHDSRFEVWYFTDTFIPDILEQPKAFKSFEGTDSENHCSSTAAVRTLSLCRIVRLCQPCQDLPKGVACQSAKCVRARQEPGRITSPAWPGAPSCPWTTAQLWTGNKRREISYKPKVVLHRTKIKITKTILYYLGTQKLHFPQFFTIDYIIWFRIH